MENQEIATRDNADLIEQAVMVGDLSKLPADQRLAYYKKVCDSMGLNPLTKPFDYITLNGKLTLYAKRDCTDQLRKLHRVSIRIDKAEAVEGVYQVTATATMADGRTDSSMGAVPFDGLKGEARANAVMKAETKAKRRVTLSIVGLGWLDESETDSIPGARVDVVDFKTGEIEQHNAEQLNKPATVAQHDEITRCAQAAGMSPAQLEERTQKKYKKSVRDVTIGEAAETIDALVKAAESKGKQPALK